MSHTPCGYKIEQGTAVVDEAAAEQIRSLYACYLAGASLQTAAEKSGIYISHSGIGRMLCNQHYIGDDYYPAIIDTDTFDAVQNERIRRAAVLGRIHPPKEKPPLTFPTNFFTREADRQSDNPYEQAEYAYTLIEREDTALGTNQKHYSDSGQESHPEKQG